MLGILENTNDRENKNGECLPNKERLSEKEDNVQIVQKYEKNVRKF